MTDGAVESTCKGCKEMPVKLWKEYDGQNKISHVKRLISKNYSLRLNIERNTTALEAEYYQTFRNFWKDVFHKNNTETIIIKLHY